jgi:hypothetical protein
LATAAVCFRWLGDTENAEANVLSNSRNIRYRRGSINGEGADDKLILVRAIERRDWRGRFEEARDLTFSIS